MFFPLKYLSRTRILRITKTTNTITELSFDFGLKTLGLNKILYENHEFVLAKQLLRSGTSIGANVEEASAALTKKDFIYKMSPASKEARETNYWLKLPDRIRIVILD